MANPEQVEIAKQWDVFVSHASEDKELASAIVAELQSCGLKVWFDSIELKLGDSLRRKIDYGLANSTYGLVIFSDDFFAKEWPRKELDALVSRDDGRRKVILPVRHGISTDRLQSLSPILADKLAIDASQGANVVAGEVFRAISAARLSQDGWTPFSVKWPDGSKMVVLPAKPTPRLASGILRSLKIAIKACVSLGELALEEVRERFEPRLSIAGPSRFGFGWADRQDTQERLLIDLLRSSGIREIAGNSSSYVMAISENLITNAQFERFVKETDRNAPIGEYFSNGSWNAPFHPWRHPKFNAPDKPVVCVSLRDVWDYTQWVNNLPKEGALSGSISLIPSPPLWRFAAFGVDRFSEAGWRNSNTEVHMLSDAPANVASESRCNIFGISDMVGNVWEWSYGLSRLSLSSGPEIGGLAMVQGGGFLDDVPRIRPELAAYELESGIDTKHADLGFRLAGMLPVSQLPRSIQMQVRCANVLTTDLLLQYR